MVLILVVLEDGLGVCIYDTKPVKDKVLILVVLEDGLGE